MKRTSRISAPLRRVALCAVVVLAATSASVAAADEAAGPFGVTAVVGASPASARVGALFGADKAGNLSGNHFCTASVVHSRRRDLIVTAAHCVDGVGESTGLVFVPGYRDGQAPYGVWRLGKRYLPDGWAHGQSEDSDVAFAVVAERDGKRVEDVTGSNRFAAGVATGATAVTVTGYPDSREVPVSCTNKPVPRSVTQQRIDCPEFTGGTSGSPWVNGDHEVVGILGGHEQGGSTPDVSYSVVLGREAAELYKDATGD
ncbi:trypsin-like peptidase domain-containing protein [Streptomyces sp. NPDC056683]|uniref:trypsin-like peptidase domain-containing protein n=1 Tax=Streptomyces sp. NPDC056683 TaxID=3345910 RepID=UPI0036B807F1